MSEHKIQLEWKNNFTDMVYETYDRTHKVFFAGGQSHLASSTKETFGKDEFVNPEEQLASAVSSCHMLTFLAIASKKRKIVLEYFDEATAILEKGDSGKLQVTKIYLRPRVKFTEEISREELDKIHESSHKNCFVGLSVKSEIIIEPVY